MWFEDSEDTWHCGKEKKRYCEPTFRVKVCEFIGLSGKSMLLGYFWLLFFCGLDMNMGKGCDYIEVLEMIHWDTNS